MNTHRTQSRQPKPLTAQQILDRFRRDMQALGYHVDVVYSTSPYAPTVSVSAWQKRDTKKGTQA